MMNRFLFYLQLGWLDLIRLWPATRQHILIVTGICLPILLLLGLKRGHVAELQKELVKSPTGRQIIFWSAQRGELLSPNSLERLAKELPKIDLAIPDTQRVCNLQGKTKNIAEGITLYSTLPGDPLLKQLGAGLQGNEEEGVILGHSLGKSIGVTLGDTVRVILIRERNGVKETAETTLKVQGLVNTGGDDSRIGFVHASALDRFEKYIRGFRVPEYQWPAIKAAARDGYAGYLLCCENNSNLTPSDKKQLEERGFQLTEATKEYLELFDSWLKPEASEKLRFYTLTSTTGWKKGRDHFHFSPSEISVNTEADDVCIPWNPTKDNGSGVQLIGMTLPKRTWLRSYFQNPALAFHYETPCFSYRAPVYAGETQSINLTSEKSIQISWLNPDPDDFPAFKSFTHQLELFQFPTNPIKSLLSGILLPWAKPNKIVVPADLLAYLHGYEEKWVDYDPEINLFVAVAEDPIYSKIRIYSETIDDVPLTVEALKTKGFAVQSESARISEIHEQDSNLKLLVLITAMGVFLFGIITIVSVLQDSTDRKRGTIGILRVMGVSPFGVFLTVFFRATAIGFLAALLGVAIGLGMEWFLGWKPPATWEWIQWKPIMRVEIHWLDMILVAGGTMLCCLGGSIAPAWKASKLDPFDAIVEGRFR